MYYDTFLTSSAVFVRLVRSFAKMKAMKRSDGIQAIRPGRNLYTRTVIPKSPLVNLVWVHGTCAKSTQFDTVVEKLSTTNSVACYLYDAMGCGQSPMLSEWDAYTTKEAALDLVAILEKFVQDKSLPTVVIGHSYAATVIIRMLAQQKEESSVAACIFLSSALKGGPVPLHNGGHLIFKLPAVALKCLQPLLTKEFIRLAYHPEADPALLETSKNADNANDMYMCKAYHGHHDWATVEEATSNIRVSCLVIHGREDKVIPVEGGQHLADIVKGKLLMVERASHQVMEEQPEQVAEAVWEFLKNRVLKSYE
jgi:abhydrolase domain-containing protein 8